mmetsp:Transcript_11006/g.34395  ORF Transcript_11006/g.34395 Transcript_11006/m.34395 type:complete len:337 (+) Transcript_11006:599-1609(+)
MAFCTPSRPSSATEILPSFSAASACRSSVASSRAFLRPAMASESSAMSLVTSFCRASLLLCSPVSVSISSLAWSRASVVLAMFSSQKPFCVASASASASSLATMSLMTLRTFTKWSSARLTRTAAAASVPLLRCCASSESSAAALLTALALAASAPLAPRSCRSTGAAAGFWGGAAAVGAGGGGCRAAWGAARRAVCRSTSLSLTLYCSVTSDSRILIASAMALSSCARTLERWSQSLAFSSHSPFSSDTKLMSASLSSSSLPFSSSSVSFCSFFIAEIFSCSSLSFSMNFFSFFMFRTFLSKSACWRNSSSSSSCLSFLKFFSRVCSVSMISSEW